MGHRFEPHTGCIVVPSERQCATILFAVAESQQINWAKSQAMSKQVLTFLLCFALKLLSHEIER